MDEVCESPTVRLYIGQSVLVVNDEPFNGTTTHAAIVTRVWGDGSHPCINVTVFPDGGAPYCRSSISYWRNVPRNALAWAELWEGDR